MYKLQSSSNAKILKHNFVYLQFIKYLYYKKCNFLKYFVYNYNYWSRYPKKGYKQYCMITLTLLLPNNNIVE